MTFLMPAYPGCRGKVVVKQMSFFSAQNIQFWITW